MNEAAEVGDEVGKGTLKHRALEQQTTLQQLDKEIEDLEKKQKSYTDKTARQIEDKLKKDRKAGQDLLQQSTTAQERAAATQKEIEDLEERLRRELFELRQNKKMAEAEARELHVSGSGILDGADELESQEMKENGILWSYRQARRDLSQEVRRARKRRNEAAKRLEKIEARIERKEREKQHLRGTGNPDLGLTKATLKARARAEAKTGAKNEEVANQEG